MLFLRRKKQKRDREAGLVFRWRGTQNYHTAKLMALVVVSGVFALFTYSVRIDGGSESPVSKRTGEVFMINEDDPNCYQILSRIEERSPFPRRWDPAYDVSTMTRVSESVKRVTGGIKKYEPLLVSVQRVDEVVDLPSILEPGSTLLGGEGKTWELDEDVNVDSGGGELYIKARITGYGDIKHRVPEVELFLPRLLAAEESYGQTFRFLIAIDGKGGVRDCLSLSAESLDLIKPSGKAQLLSSWLRRQRFLSVDEELEQRGVIELQIEAQRE